ncbi:MAG: hypothetical protein IH899_10415, partial [Planctomycetes bacterium]|nr:hypothetical protein [Planctomycetota bacterium]
MTTATLIEPENSSAPTVPPGEGTPQTLPLGERLFHAGIVTAAELEAGLREQTTKRLRLGEVLIELGFVKEEQLLPFLGEQLQVTSVRLREGLVDPAIVNLIPRSKAEALKAIALFKVRGTL